MTTRCEAKVFLLVGVLNLVGVVCNRVLALFGVILQVFDHVLPDTIASRIYGS